jgi:hypothetical protein
MNQIIANEITIFVPDIEHLLIEAKSEDGALIKILVAIGTLQGLLSLHNMLAQHVHTYGEDTPLPEISFTTPYGRFEICKKAGDKGHE